jgi:hypothetical protein
VRAGFRINNIRQEIRYYADRKDQNQESIAVLGCHDRIHGRKPQGQKMGTLVVGGNQAFSAAWNFVDRKRLCIAEVLGPTPQPHSETSPTNSRKAEE